MNNYGSCKLCGNTKLNLVLQAQDFQILECGHCKIAFTNPPPTLPDYVNMDFHSGENKEKAERLTSIEDLQPDWQMLIRMQAKMIMRRNTRGESVGRWRWLQSR